MASVTPGTQLGSAFVLCVAFGYGAHWLQSITAAGAEENTSEVGGNWSRIARIGVVKAPKVRLGISSLLTTDKKKDRPVAAPTFTQQIPAN
ncbi:MAG: hypothetical protein R3F40_13135 [Candidatus Competibacteraceae bacterium]